MSKFVIFYILILGILHVSLCSDSVKSISVARRRDDDDYFHGNTNSGDGVEYEYGNDDATYDDRDDDIHDDAYDDPDPIPSGKNTQPDSLT